MSERMPVIAGNWKMHHDHYVAIQVVQKLSYRLEPADYEACEVVVCPPFTDPLPRDGAGPRAASVAPA